MPAKEILDQKKQVAKQKPAQHTIYSYFNYSNIHIDHKFYEISTFFLNIFFKPAQNT